MQLEVVFDSKELNKKLDVMLKQMPKCVDRAVYDSMKKGLTALSKNARQIYTIKKKDFDSYTRISNNSIKVRSNPFTSVHYPSTPKGYKSMEGVKVSKRPKATLTVLKGKKSSVKGGFIMNPSRVRGGNVMLWHRNGKYKDPPSKTPTGRPSRAEHGMALAEPVRRTSAAQMASNEAVYEPTMGVIKEAFPERLEHYYERMKV